MSKKKKQKKYNQGYDQKDLNQRADFIEEYINTIDSYFIIHGISKERYDKAMKRLRKTIDDLRNGNGDAEFDPDRYHEMNERKDDIYED